MGRGRLWHVHQQRLVLVYRSGETFTHQIIDNVNMFLSGSCTLDICQMSPLDSIVLFNHGQYATIDCDSADFYLKLDSEHNVLLGGKG